MGIVVFIIIAIAIGMYLNRRDEEARLEKERIAEESRKRYQREQEESRKRWEAEQAQREAERKKVEDERDAKYKPTDHSDEMRRLAAYNERISKIINTPNEIDYNDFRKDFDLFLQSYKKYLGKNGEAVTLGRMVENMSFPLSEFVGNYKNNKRFLFPTVLDPSLLSLFCISKRLVFFDIETTGLNFARDTIIEFAYQIYEGIDRKYKSTGMESGYDYLEPHKVKEESFLVQIPDYVDYSQEVQNLTGIAPEQLKNGISRKEAHDKILELFSDNMDTLFIAYNASFDLTFIHSFLGQNNGEVLNNISVYDPYVDLRSEIVWFTPWGDSIDTNKKHKLTDWIGRMNLNFKSHRALNDVEALFWVTKKYFNSPYKHALTLNTVMTPKDTSFRLKQLKYEDYRDHED